MNASANPKHPEPELLDREVHVADTAALIRLNRAEIDVQIATAHAFPRSVTAFMRDATELVTLTNDMAEACIYALPRGGKTLTGASVRFAEVIAHCFGNNLHGARVVADDGNFIVAQGVYHDLEKNSKTTMEVRRPIIDKYGKRFKDDMVGVTGNAAASIAHRNAILKGVPKALWLPIYEAARQVAIGDVTTLADRRAKAIAWFGTVGITPAQVCVRLGVEGVDDIGLPELELLTGLRTAIRDGSSTPEAAFAPEEPDTNVAAPTNKSAVADMAEKLDRRRRGAATAAPAAATPPPDDPAAPSAADGLQRDRDTGEILPPDLQ